MKHGRLVRCRYCETDIRIRMLPRHLTRKCPMAPSVSAEQHICSVCQNVKARTDFPHSSIKPLGIDNRCKACHAAHRTEWARQLKAGERKIVRAFKERPGRWVLHPCEFCGEMLCARDVKPHRVRCPKRPPTKGQIEGPIRMQERLDREAKKAYRMANRKTIEWEANLKSKYGIDMAEYQRMLAAQGGVCAICKLPPLGKNKRDRVLHVDHSHRTNKIRALLCHKCNHVVGFSREDPAILIAAIAYLTKHSPIAEVS